MRSPNKMRASYFALVREKPDARRSTWQKKGLALV
jgi:hypothetical protein